MDKKFDEHIKASMQHLEMPYHASHWQRIEASLNGMEKEETAAVENAFDALISGKLENFSSDIQMPDWNRMEAALEKSTVSDEVFDKEVKSKAARIRPTYQSSHWELLAERLRREKAIKESLVKNKVAELVIFALLLLNFYQYFPNQHTVESLPILAEPIEQEPTKIAPVVLESLPIKEKDTAPTAQLSTTPKSKLVEQQVSIVNQVIDNSTPTTIVGNSTPNNSLTDYRLFISPTLTPVAISGVSSQPSLQQVMFGIDGKTGLTISVAEMTRHLAYVGLGNVALAEPIPSLQPASLATATISLGCKKCKKPKVPARFRFGIVGHVGGTSAVRSASEILSIDGLIQKGNGYGGGFTLGFKRGNGELETGFIYAAKGYDPNINDATKQFKGINLQTLRIPVNLRLNYAVLNKGKWHLYMQTGGAINVILRAQYDIVEVSQTDNKSLTNFSSSRLSRFVYNRGFLGGDSFRDNRFLSLNIGTGAEYYLSSKWSAFLEPEFNYFLSKSRIGPTEDRINSVSVSFGLKASFY